MKIPTLFKEYIWLIETIYEAGKISFAEINEKWCRTEESGGVFEVNALTIIASNRTRTLLANYRRRLLKLLETAQ